MHIRKSLPWSDYVKLALSYAVFTQNEDNSWTVEIPALPGCITSGRTRVEAALMAEDAIQGWLVTAIRFNDDIPLIEGYSLANVDDGVAKEVVGASSRA